MALTYPYAAAALVVEVDRAWTASPNAPIRVAMGLRTLREYWRLSWRPTRSEPTPLAWNPWEMADELAEEGIVEAALKYRLEAGVETRPALGDGTGCALTRRYEVSEDEGQTAPMWRAPGRKTGQALVRLGGVQRRHFYGGTEAYRDAATGEIMQRGRWRTPAELGELLGRGGRVVDGVRRGGRLTAGERREYVELLSNMTAEENEWVAAQSGPPMRRAAEIAVEEVRAAGKDRTGRCVYLLRWTDGTERWGQRPRQVSQEVARELRGARKAYEEGAGEGLREWVRRMRGHTELWLATEAPLAVGQMDAAKLIELAARNGVRSVIAEHASMEVAAREDRVRGETQAAEAAEAEVAMAEQQSREAELRGGWLGLREAQEMATKAEMAEGARFRAAAHEAAKAAAAHSQRQDAARRMAAAQLAEAEWVAAQARTAATCVTWDMLDWAMRKPGFQTAIAENAEGAGAAERALQSTVPTSFSPSARAVNFMGRMPPRTQLASTADGMTATAEDTTAEATHGGMHTSLDVSDADAAAATWLPDSMRLPNLAEARTDVRVAWEDDDRMWTGEVPQMTAEEAERAAAARLLAMERRAAAEARDAAAEDDRQQAQRARNAERGGVLTGGGEHGAEGEVARPEPDGERGRHRDTPMQRLAQQLDARDAQEAAAWEAEQVGAMRREEGGGGARGGGDGGADTCPDEEM